MRAEMISLMTCLSILLTGCGQEPEESIIGKWRQGPKNGLFTKVSASGPGIMTFHFQDNGTLITQGGVQANTTRLDGTTVTQGGTTPVTHRYEFVGDHTIQISFAEGVLFRGREVLMKLELSRSQMTLTETAPSGLPFMQSGSITLQKN